MGWRVVKEQNWPQTLFEDDLGITGDDGVDLPRATEKQFDVQLSSREDGYRETFNLAPNEYLFNSEGFGVDLRFWLTLSPSASSPIVRAFTVGELYEAVQKAMRQQSEE